MQKALEAGYSASDVNAFIGKKQTEEIAAAGVPLGEIQKDPTLRGIQYGQAVTGQYAPEKSAAVKKRELILNQAAPVLNRIVSSAMIAPEGWEGWWKATTGKIPGVAGGEAEFLERQTAGFARLIASAFASEVGVATDKDVNRWKSIMPKPSDTMEERQRMSQDLINQILSESQALGIEVPLPIIQSQLSMQQPEAKESGGIGGAIQKAPTAGVSTMARKGLDSILTSGTGQLLSSILPFPYNLALSGGVGALPKATDIAGERLGKAQRGEVPSYGEQLGQLPGTAKEIAKPFLGNVALQALLSPGKTLGGLRQTAAAPHADLPEMLDVKSQAWKTAKDPRASLEEALQSEAVAKDIQQLVRDKSLATSLLDKLLSGYLGLKSQASGIARKTIPWAVGGSIVGKMKGWF